ncbi:uncharacterized protein LOC134805838 [Cydia splendana]|uniref:uncharacterized protein LOC134805838 n=1 Tax=Cydia splendana TaxID=1100963 RepID=UPI00300C7836
MEKFDQVQQAIELLEQDEKKADEERSIMESRYYQTRALINKLLEKKEEDIKAKSQPVYKLPKLELPTYSGDIREWPAFKNLFQCAMDGGNVPELQRMQYLKSCLKGEAAGLINSLLILDGNFSKAMSILENSSGVRGAKNLRQRSGYPPRRRLALVTHNIRTMRTDEKICELEEELSRLHWDIVGLCEVRREGEDTTTLKSGNLLYHREGDQQSQGGVGFLVHKSLVNNIITIDSVSSRVVYLILRISKRYSLKVIQVYAPTSSHSDDEVEAMYEDVSRAIHTSKTYFTVVMGDFNAKLGKRSGDELRVGQFGYGQRNPRGQRLADFLEREELFMMNSFFQKPPHRKWTWMSPDGSTRNEIDFIMTDKKRIFSDVSVINRTIERNQGSKVFAKDKSIGQSQLTKLKREDGSIASSKAEVLGEIERFYGQLYTSIAKPVDSLVGDPRAKLSRHYTEDIPDISLYEIRMALKQLKNNKAPGKDGITSELLRAGGTPVLKVLQKLFNSVLSEGITPETWNRGEVVLFFKKGDNNLLKNYRPITLLSHVYKLFSRVITNRLEHRLDDFRPPEQAGFRKGYSTIDHIHTLRQVIQKTEEYNLPLCLAFVDYEKAFDSVETWAVLESLQRCHIDYRYIEVLKCLYSNATMSVRVQEQSTRAIPLRRGVRQGDVISPKLFTAVMEDAFKLLEWEGLGININGEYITHLRFADDIVVMAKSMEELSMMLDDLNRVSQRVGLKMNMDKTKLMSNANVVPIPVSVGNSVLEVVDSYIYLGQVVQLGRSNFEKEVNRRIQLGWAAFGKLRNVFSSDIPQCLKTKVFNQCVLPVMTYGSESGLSLSASSQNLKSLNELWRGLCSEFLYVIESEMRRSVDELKSPT